MHHGGSTPVEGIYTRKYNVRSNGGQINLTCS